MKIQKKALIKFLSKILPILIIGFSAIPGKTGLSKNQSSERGKERKKMNSNPVNADTKTHIQTATFALG